MAEYDDIAERFMVEIIGIGLLVIIINLTFASNPSGGGLVLSALVSLIATAIVIYRLFSHVNRLIDRKMSSDEVEDTDTSTTDTPHSNVS